MKKKNWLKLICSICLVVFATLTLTACGGAENPVSSSPEGGGYQSGSSSPSVNVPGGDSSTSSKDPSDSSSSEEPPEVEEVDFSQYFSGYVVLTNGNSTYTVEDENGNQVLFNDLLDRQFDILAQDLIYRLTYVYGNARETNTEVGRWYPLTIKNNGSDVQYEYNSKTANVDASAVVSSSTCSQHSSNLNLKCLDCYQSFLNKTRATDNYLFDTNNLYLANAIDGKFTSLNAFQLKNDVVASNKWNYSLTDSSLLASYKNQMKMAFAQIVAGKTVTAAYTSDAYNNLLSSINTLGLFDSYKEPIVDFIKDVVIDGPTNKIIENDDALLEQTYIKTTKSYVVDSTFMTGAPYPGNASFSEAENNKSPRLYKGYSLLIPAMVDQAFANTFDQTTTSIYPHFSRVNGSKGTFETYTITSKDQNGEDTEVQELTTTGALNLNSIILKPQEGAAPLSLELQIDVARALTDDYPGGMSVGDAGYINYFARDIVVELEVDITYKVGDTIVKISKAIADEADGSSIITLDSKTGYIMKQLDYNDPNFDPTRIDEEGYADQFMKPVQSENGTILPYEYTYSLYESFPDEKVTPLTKYSGFDPDTDKNTLWNNKFVKDDENEMIYLDAGTSYIQINFNIVSIKKYGGDNNSQLTDYIGNDVVFDITVKPYT